MSLVLECSIHAPLFGVIIPVLLHYPLILFFHSRTEHIEVDIYFIREKVEAKILEVQYVPTTHQIANIMTKPLAQVQQTKH